MSKGGTPSFNGRFTGFIHRGLEFFISGLVLLEKSLKLLDSCDLGLVNVDGWVNVFLFSSVASLSTMSIIVRDKGKTYHQRLQEADLAFSQGRSCLSPPDFLLCNFQPIFKFLEISFECFAFLLSIRCPGLRRPKRRDGGTVLFEESSVSQTEVGKRLGDRYRSRRGSCRIFRA